MSRRSLFSIEITVVGILFEPILYCREQGAPCDPAQDPRAPGGTLEYVVSSFPCWECAAPSHSGPNEVFRKLPGWRTYWGLAWH